MGKALPASYSEGEREFDERIKSRFPLGSNEADLIAYVSADGFKLDRGGANFRSATLTRGMVFKKIWSIRWRSNAGKIDVVWGVYGAIAP